ncbi:hypothetical protein, partial [Paenibacillus sp. AR247]|uniref:hypothetical protein n=1 Tax=Paenibacillus sp. AR247 TaxID=1631599 RepID=UPI000D48C8FB
VPRRPTPRRAGAGRRRHPPRPKGTSARPTTAEQRVFVKITPEAENPDLLARLKQLLQEHPGPVATVLFYEQSQKLLALSDNYRIKPSPGFFEMIENMLGKGTVRIK